MLGTAERWPMSASATQNNEHDCSCVPALEYSLCLLCSLPGSPRSCAEPSGFGAELRSKNEISSLNRCAG